MARVNNLTNFLNDVATAIKQKLGDNTPIPASQFDTKIGEIETGGNYQTKSITITTNGTYTQLPDTGFDAMDQVVISVNVPAGTDTSDATATAEDLIEGTTAYVNGEKIEGTLEVTDAISIDNSTNTDTSITLMNLGDIPSMVIDADINDFYGVRKIVEDGTGLEIIAPQSQIANVINLTAEKIVSGNTILDIEGTGGGNVKLFETIADMQDDTTAQEGDLAVVYRNELTAATEESEFSSCIFPNTVVLSSAFSGSIHGSFRAVDQSVMFNGLVDMSSSRFRFTGYGDIRVRVQYASSDGITYTRTDGGEELQEFGVTIKYEPTIPWNDVIGNFMQIGGNYFEGLYEYTLNNKDVTKIRLPLLTDGEFDTANKKYNVTNFSVAFDVDKIVKLRDKIREDYGILTDTISGEFNVFTKNDKLVLLAVHNRSGNGSLDLAGGIRYYSTSKKFKIYSSSTFTGDVHEFVLDLDNMTYTDTVVGTQDGSGSSPYYFELDYEVQSFMCLLRYGSVYGNKTLTNFEAWFQYDVSETYNATGIGSDYYDVYDAYIPIKSQLDATPEYVYEKTFYGKNGVENGTLGIPDNSFADTTAKVVYEIQNQYENMEPRILTDNDKTINKNIYFIPVKRDGTPLLDTSSVTNMQNMFGSCTNLTTIPLLDTSNVTNMQYMFNLCQNLVEIPLLDTSNVTNMDGMFGSCSNLASIPLLDTGNVTDVGNMFSGCSSLTTIPLLDTSNVTNMQYMFNGCTNLTDDSLNIIMQMCTNAVKITSNKTLKYIGLTLEQVNKCKTLSNYQAFVNAGWTTGY